MASARIKSLLDDPFIPALLRADLAPETDQTDRLWDRWLREGLQADFNRLVEFYAPIAALSARRSKHRAPTFYIDPIEDLLSDGLAELVRLIGRTTLRIPAGALVKCVRGRIFRECARRNWGGSKRYVRHAIIRDARARHFAEHGQLPTQSELVESLRGIITNRAIQIGDVPATHRFSELEKSERRGAFDIAASKPEPSSIQIRPGELRRLAGQILKGAELQAFLMSLDGKRQEDIARVLGVSRERARQRISGAMWTMRAHRDFAGRFGFEPSKAPTIKEKYHIRRAAPARLAMAG
jgi:DNA-directed RNA polymerase specialized sigma subunit